MCYTFQKRKSPPLEEEKRLKPENCHPDPILITNTLLISFGTKEAKRPAKVIGRTLLSSVLKLVRIDESTINHEPLTFNHKP